MIGSWNWQPYESLARTMSLRYGVAPELILAIMGVESSFQPTAYRAEPQINDASRGLMQLLLTTARALGFSGEASQLFDAATNADLGTKLLAQNLTARGYDMASAISQYNGGYRPSLGFGAPFADGSFGNQTYVDRVLQAWREFTDYFGGTAPGTPGPGPDPGGGRPPEPPGPSNVLLMVLAVALGAIAALRGGRAA